MIEEKDQEFLVYCGIDWATQSHQVCALDRNRKLIEQRAVAHSGDSLTTLSQWLIGLAQGESRRVAVGIEVPHGAVVETLIEAGLVVFAINPKQLDRLRDRRTVAGAKDDRLDALVLADGVATDRHLFRRVRLDPPRIVELREVSRMHDELREQINMASNRLRQQLWRFFPQVLSLGDTTERWLWDLVELVQTPSRVSRVRKERIHAVLKRHRIRRHDADSVLAALRQTALRVAPGTSEAASFHVRVLIEQLRLLDRQKQHCDARAREILCALTASEPSDGQLRENMPEDAAPSREPCDVEILRSLPGVGDYVVATVIAEASQALGARDYATLRALMGVAPVTKRSGKTLVVLRRRAANPRLVDAAHFWGQGSLRADPASREHYHRLRSSGHTHARALRGVVDRLLQVAVAMLTARTTYDPDHRHRSQPSATQQGAHSAPQEAA